VEAQYPGASGGKVRYRATMQGFVAVLEWRCIRRTATAP
jgi:hypothetical protein